MALLYGLTTDSRSHLYAAISGQTYQGSHADFAMTLLAGIVLNLGKKSGEKRIEMPGPFYGAKQKAQKAQQVPQAEQKRLEERLRTFSSIPD